MKGKGNKAVERLKSSVLGEAIEGLTSMAHLKALVGSSEDIIELAGSRENLRALWQSGFFKHQKPSTFAGILPQFMKRGAHPGICFYLHAHNNPNKIGLIDHRGSLTFKELNERANRLAHGLLDRDVEPGDGVAFMLDNNREFIETLGACGKIGASAVPVNTKFRVPEISVVLRNIQTRAIIFDVKYKELVMEAAKGLENSLVHRPFIATGVGDIPDNASAYEETLASASADEVPLMGTHGGGRVIIHTSGTTGKPKGAERNLSRAGLSSLAEILRMVPLRYDDVFAVASPMFHALGYGFATLAFSLGSTLCMMDRFDPELFLKIIEKNGVTATAVVPIMLRRILDQPSEVLDRYEVSSIRLMLSSGSHLPDPVRKKASNYFGPVMYNLYGATEIGWATIAKPEDYDRYPGTIGRPAPNVDITTLNEAREETTVGVKGEIFVKNRLIFEGYSGKKQDDDRYWNGYYSVGDIGWKNQDGYLFVSDRKDDMIVSGGENIYPAEVENALEEHPDLEESAVVGAPDAEWGQVLKAFVVKHPGAEVAPEDLKAFLKARIANYKVPKNFIFIDALPRNAVGKILKKTLREEAVSS